MRGGGVQVQGTMESKGGDRSGMLDGGVESTVGGTVMELMLVTRLLARSGAGWRMSPD